MTTAKLMRAMVLAAGCVGAVALPAMAIDEPAPAADKAERASKKLVAGMKAPPFKVERFIKGKEFSAFEPGKVYVIEFWATWCGPCIMSMPHISELQREFGPKGVTICGVNVREDKSYSAETYDKVAKFVNAKPDRMAYTVAYDGEAQFMETNWMQAAQARGIPTAFVVDGTGTIAWIGHPMMMDMVLDEVTSGSWDIQKGDAKIKAAMKSFEDAGQKYTESLDAGEKAWSAAVAAYPVLAKQATVDRVMAMIEAKHYAAAAKAGEDVIASSLAARKHGPVMELIGGFGDPEIAGIKELQPLMLKAAEANMTLGDPTEAGPHVALARALWYNGQNDKAQAAADKALELASSDPIRRSRIEKYLKDAEKAAKGD